MDKHGQRPSNIEAFKGPDHLRDYIHMDAKQTAKVECHDWRKEDKIKMTWGEAAKIAGAVVAVGTFLILTECSGQIFGNKEWPSFRVPRPEPSPFPNIGFPTPTR